MTNILFILLLIFCSSYDAVCQKIPNLLPLAISLLAIFRIIQTPAQCCDCIIGFFILSVPMLLLRIRRGGLGGGDIKLTAACGLYLGTTRLLLGTFFAA